MGLGLYIHIPFCEKKCYYCNFYSITGFSQNIVDKYFDRLKEELSEYNSEEIDSIYLGGGTPSVIAYEKYFDLMSYLESNFTLDLKEFTFEYNPIHFDIDYLNKIYDLGVTRISFGVQSFIDKKLELLGRLHRFSDLKKIFKNRDLFKNISIDLIFGLKKDFRLIKKDLNYIKKLEPEHLSIYNLKVEKNTRLYEMIKKGEVSLQNENEEAETYEYINRFLKRNGYKHYEISNYCLDDFYSIHNLKYWHFDDFIGIGVSAAGYYKNKYYKNHDSIKRYLENGYHAHEESIDKNMKEYYKIIMGLRLEQGIKLSDNRIIKLKKSRVNKFIEIKNKRVSIKEKYFFISNSIINEITELLLKRESE